MTARSVPTDAEIRDVLRRFPVLEQEGRATRLGKGLIHDTYLVVAPAGRFVLQRQHGVFGPEVNYDIAAVTEHLRKRGVITPELVSADDGEPFVLSSGATWRLMTEVAGTTFDVVPSLAHARAAGGMLGQFHSAFIDFDHVFRHRRFGVHDTAAHLERLRSTVANGRGHRLYDRVNDLARRLLRAAERLEHIDAVPQRIVHGDPKLNNFIFRAAPEAEAVCLIDLDTVGPMPLHFELGDCWRSWCNLGGEDENAPRFDMDVFAAAVEGYRIGSSFEPSTVERRALLVGVEWVTLELSARFAADALREQYFGWDALRYPAAGEHNIARAEVQWQLHESVIACRDARERVLARVF